MIITKLYGKERDEFHEKHPNSFLVKSESFEFGSMTKVYEIVDWTKENFEDEALMSWEHPVKTMVIMVWYCISEDDAFAAKMRWS